MCSVSSRCTCRWKYAPIDRRHRPVIYAEWVTLNTIGRQHNTPKWGLTRYSFVTAAALIAASSLSLIRGLCAMDRFWEVDTKGGGCSGVGVGLGATNSKSVNHRNRVYRTSVAPLTETAFTPSRSINVARSRDILVVLIDLFSDCKGVFSWRILLNFLQFVCGDKGVRT